MINHHLLFDIVNIIILFYHLYKKLKYIILIKNAIPHIFIVEFSILNAISFINLNFPLTLFILILA